VYAAPFSRVGGAWNNSLALLQFGAAAAFTISFLWTSQSVQYKRNSYFSGLRSELDSLKKKNQDLEHEIELLSACPQILSFFCSSTEGGVSTSTENPPPPKEEHGDLMTEFENGTLDFDKLFEQLLS